MPVRSPYSFDVILAAALLILAGLALFVAGILTGLTALYWACVAACVVAGILLIAAWRRMPARQPTAAEPARVAEGAEKPAGAETSASAPATTPHGVAPDQPDPGVEEVEVTDLLVIVDLTDEVLVVDEHPRYHVAGCAWLAGREILPLPLDEARTDGFTPCAVCAPDRALAGRARTRRSSAAGQPEP